MSDKCIGSSLKKLRAENDESLAELAEAVDASASAISNYERGIRYPDSSILIKLAEHYNCTMDYIVGLSEHKNPKSAAIVMDSYKKLEDSLNSLPPETAQQLAEQISELIKQGLGNLVLSQTQEWLKEYYRLTRYVKQMMKVD